MVQIRWLKEARNDLKDIFIENLLVNNSKSYAKLQVNLILKVAEILKKQVDIGRKINDFKEEEIREYIQDHFKIVYRIFKADTIIILMVIPWNVEKVEEKSKGRRSKH
jgi:plasmid stabilization system protein ParE